MKLEWDDQKKRYELNIMGFKIYSVFQAITDSCGVPFGYEALCRIEIQGEYVSIKKFYKMLEDFGQDTEFKFKFALNLMHLRNFRGSRLYNDEVKIFLNITPCFFKKFVIDSGLSELYVEQVIKEKVRFDQIVAEIVEDYCPVVDIESLHKGVNYLKNLGVSVAMDDFGTGWSGYSRLAVIQPDYVKISREMLIESEVLSGKDGSRLDEIMVVSSLREIKVIFEGVESQDNVNLAMKYGGSLFQGYYFDIPRSYQVLKEKCSNALKRNQFLLSSYLTSGTYITSK
ncbi:EAL domain-containing protein [Vibrio coralliilyticus]|uniref:EAL domain-containing protein n=1 Tax=Vibrio coralliilyticus TaxID=190893 RepID=UPI00155FB3D6|nr:EAL domain-containing protein [Vibrio coralliilyticus]NRF12903.1 EAL domain-containing protein [Vibrio coralliilyticus]